MIIHTHWLTRRGLHRMFTTGVSERTRRRLMSSVDQCNDCAAVCRNYYQYESALYHSHNKVPPALADRISRAIFTQYATSSTSRRTLWYKISGAVATAVVLAAFLTKIFLFSPSSHRVVFPAHSSNKLLELTPRSTSSAGSPEFGIRVFGIAAEDESISETGKVSICDKITFSYTRACPGDGFVAIFGIQPNADIIWYYPDFQEPQSMLISGDRIDEPLNDGFILSVHHRPGPLLIFSVFSDIQISSKTIETTMEKFTHNSDADHQSLNLLAIDGVNSAQVIQLEIENCDD